MSKVLYAVIWTRIEERNVSVMFGPMLATETDATELAESYRPRAGYLITSDFATANKSAHDWEDNPVYAHATVSDTRKAVTL